jgi:hypothetical protein
MNYPLINGVGYSWASIKVTVLGRMVIGIRAIDYKDSQAIEGTYGAGNQAIEVGFGNITNEGNITLLGYELDALELLAPNGRIQEIPPFDIIVSWNAGTSVKVHRLENCIFKDNGRSNSQGDTMSEFQVPLFIGQIKFNVN